MTEVGNPGQEKSSRDRELGRKSGKQGSDPWAFEVRVQWRIKILLPEGEKP